MSTFAHDDDNVVDVSKQVSPGQQSVSLPSLVQGIQQLSAASSIDVPQKRVGDVLIIVVEPIVVASVVMVFVDDNDENDGTVGSIVSSAPAVVVAEAVASSSAVAQVTTAAQSHMPPDPTAPLNNSPGGQLW